MAEGLQKIPLRIPTQWDASWFARFCREVLALGDIRNAVAGTGISITGQSGEVATLSASDEFLGLLDVPFVTLDTSSVLTNERVLDAGPGIIITDNGAGSTVEIKVDSGALFGSLNAFTVIGNPFEVSGPSIQISGNVEGDVLTIQDVSGDPAVVWTNTPTWSGRHTWINADNSATVLVSNAFDNGAGVELSTSGADAFGINSQLAHWETSSKLFGFRWFADGTPVGQAYLDLYRHDNNASGAQVLRITRTTGYVDLFSRLQLADGSLALPALTFTSDDNLGLYRIGADQLGIGATISTMTSATDTVAEVRSTSASNFAFASYLDSAGTRVLNIGYGNSGSTVSNAGFLNTPTGIDFLFRTSGTERWRIIGASGHFRSQDNVALQIGAGSDLNLSHDGTNSYVDNNTGDLIFRGAAVERMRMTSAGIGLQVQGISNQLAIHAQAANTSGQSFGVRIFAGTTIADYALRVADQTGATDFMRVMGDGRSRFLDGTAALPALSFLSDTDTGIYRIGADNIGISAGGTLRLDIDGTDMVFTVLSRGPAGSNTTPAYSFSGDNNTGMYSQGADAIGLAANGGEVARFDANATAGNTRFMVYDVDNGTLERVTVGAADSGGAGFKVLRIPN